MCLSGALLTHNFSQFQISVQNATKWEQGRVLIIFLTVLLRDYVYKIWCNSDNRNRVISLSPSTFDHFQSPIKNRIKWNFELEAVLVWISLGVRSITAKVFWKTFTILEWQGCEMWPLCFLVYYGFRRCVFLKSGGNHQRGRWLSLYIIFYLYFFFLYILHSSSLKFEFWPIMSVWECHKYFPSQFTQTYEFLSLLLILFPNDSLNAVSWTFFLFLLKNPKTYAQLYVKFYYATGHL